MENRAVMSNNEPKILLRPKPTLIWAAIHSSVSIRNALGRREIAVRFHPDEVQKKTILIDQKKITRFSDMMGCLRCVIFSPEDLGLIKEGPSLRRRFLDMMISQINRGYFIALQQGSGRNAVTC